MMLLVKTKVHFRDIRNKRQDQTLKQKNGDYIVYKRFGHLHHIPPLSVKMNLVLSKTTVAITFIESTYIIICMFSIKLLQL